MAITRIILVFLTVFTLVVAGCSSSPPEAGPPPAGLSTPTSPQSSTEQSTPPVGQSPSPAGRDADEQEKGGSRPGTIPPVIAHGRRDRRRVALTFDADMTDAMAKSLRTGKVRSYANLAMIELLEREEVPATFFVTGQWAEQYPDVLERLVANPRFEIANHSYEHAAFTGDCYGLPRVPPKEMTEDVAKTFRVLKPYGGRQTRYFRFPGLCHDRAALAALRPLGITVVDGDVVSGDPFATGAKPVINAVLSQVQPGSIVIMHVTEANARFSDEALPPILKGLDKRHLEPVTLSDLMADH